MHIQKIDVGTPIGNLYRKSHALILLTKPGGKFILGKKEGFYPANMARFVGGGVQENEIPLEGAVRELGEELGIVKQPNDLKLLAEIKTEANTSEGNMSMLTSVFYCQLDENDTYKAADDLNGLLEIDLNEFRNLITAMYQLSGLYIADTFSFDWADWGKIYGPIHELSLENYLVNL